MNEDVITVVGSLGGDPTLKSVNGDRVAGFRLASTSKRKEGEAWVDVRTNWFSVEAWGDFAQHVAASLRKGDLVVVLGKLKIDDWESGERRGTSVKIRADHIGLSLRTGAVAKDRRAREPRPDAAAVPAAAVAIEPRPAMALSGQQEAWTAPLTESETPF